jgi:hypothetical protein
MAYDEDLANRIREIVQDEPGLTEKRMFGGLAFLVNGTMAVSASGQGGMLLRVDPTDTPALVQRPEADRFEMRGRELMAGSGSIRPDWLRNAGSSHGCPGESAMPDRCQQSDAAATQGRPVLPLITHGRLHERCRARRLWFAVRRVRRRLDWRRGRPRVIAGSGWLRRRGRAVGQQIGNSGSLSTGLNCVQRL